MASSFRHAMLLVLLFLFGGSSGNFLNLKENTDDVETRILPPTTPSHFCDYYDDKPKFTEGPCKSVDDLNDKGVCNTTQRCGKDSHCYMSWRNVSGVVTVVKSGCWLNNNDHCEDRRDCRAVNDSILSHHEVHYCCCLGDFCNRNFYLDTTVKGDPGEEPVEEQRTDLLILVKILVPLFVFCILVVLGYCFYRRRKEQYDDMDGVSVDTPATGATRCTTVPFPSMDIPTPQLLDVKARGRFGKVWRAQLHDKIVAVKTFNLSEKSSWQNEQDIFCTPLMNTHANILRFLTASNKGEGMASEFWLITEFYERGSLADFLKVNTVRRDEALRIMKTMASGMSFLHEDIISPTHDNKPSIAHRDFKSKNVLLDQNLNAVIADFGLAVKFLPGESPGESHGQVGTLRYMAPEVLEGAINFQKDAFLRIDMYAFGLVMWEILSRCTAVGECGSFLMPFEKELGSTPLIDQLQEYVTERKGRPVIEVVWREDKELAVVCETIEECWDHDAEARLSAGCVELRITGIQKQRASDPARIIENMVPSSHQGNYIDTENAMNQRNLQVTILNENNKNMMPQPNGNATTTFSEGEQTRDPNHKTEDTYVDTYQDDDHDSGTFANEDTLSHDGVMDQLMAHDTDLEVRLENGNSDSASSLLTSDERETNL